MSESDDPRCPPRLPSWLRRPHPADRRFRQTEQILRDLDLQTICMHANCPNRGACWARGTATVLILGPVCTRHCGFCSVARGRPAPPDPSEPARLAEMVARMGLRYLVITSVNRDDLPDGGAGHFRDCVLAVRKAQPRIQFELLVPDFRNCQAEAVTCLGQAMPFVFAHNVETVPALYPRARQGGDYAGSLALLRQAKSLAGVQTKSSIMLGLGETDDQVDAVLRDLREAGCDRLTVGQYLRPSKDSLEVVEYVTPARFERWRQRAKDLGFSWVLSEPFARSSYLAEIGPDARRDVEN
jgi:lipoyl synthase